MRNNTIICKSTYLVFFVLICVIKTKSQDIVSGKIISARNGTALESVSIYIKNGKHNQHLHTDSNGKFKFSLSNPKEDLKIQLSAIGYSKLDTTLNIFQEPQKEIIFRLKETPTKLEVVDITVSTGYQSLPKERSTGSFSYINRNKLNEQVSTEILTKLDGTISGVVFDRGTNSSPRISVRGLSTLQPSMNAPLIILDNFPYDGDINNINPNDVENITVLKDAAAASIWGAKAANGVIVITTKKGKLNQPVKVEIVANSTIIDKPNLFKLKQMSSSEFIDVEELLYSRGYYSNDINSSAKPVLSPVVELLIKRSTASESEIREIDNQIEVLRKHDVRNDFNKYIYKKGVNQQYALSMNGGSAFIGWNAFVGSDINSDNLGNKYNRINMRIQNSIVISKNLRLSSNLSFIKSGNRSGRQGIGEIVSKGGFLFPYAKLADEYGKSLAIPKDWRFQYIDTFGEGKLLDWKYYPLEEYKNLDHRNDISHIISSVGLNYNFLKSFKADLLYQYERQSTSAKDLRGSESYFARDLINGFSQFDAFGNIVRRIPEGAIITYQDEIMSSHNWRGQLGFDKNTEKHLVSAIIGSEIRQSSQTGHSNRSYGFDPNTMTYGNVDYTTSYPNLITGSPSFIDNGVASNEKNIRFISVYANAAYTYQKKYTVSASARRDASNLFGFKTNDRWNPLWSSGIGWQISNEAIYQNSRISHFIPYLKIRATYGFSGNIHPSLAALTTIRYRGKSIYTQLPYASFDKYANPELKWETTGMLNLGVDFGLKNNRINGSIEYYNKKSSDLFANVPIDYTGGIGSTVVKNAGEMKSNGWDIVLNSLNVDRQFKWKTEINLSVNQDKITKYYLSYNRGSNFMMVIPTVTGAQGKPVYSILSYKWAGLDPKTGASRGYVDGKVSAEYSEIIGNKTTINDLVYHGSANPTIFGSIGNTFSWNGFSASLRIQYKLKYFFRKQTILYSSLFSNWEGNSDYSKRWIGPGDEKITNIPSLVYPASPQSEAFYQFAEPFVLRGDHIRLQYINFAYQFDKKQLKSVPLEQLKVFVAASNLGILWRANKEKIDPDYSYNANMLEPSKMWSFGIQVIF